MTSSQPLLSSSSCDPDPSPVEPPPPPLNIVSLSCFCPATSFSSSIFDDARRDSLDAKDNDIVAVGDTDCYEKPLDHTDSVVTLESFYSAESQRVQQFLLECSTKERRKERRHLVPWGTMELQESPTTLERSGISPVQDRVSKSQRIRHKSLQFEDNLSPEENPRLIYVNDPKKTNEKYEFTGNEIRTSKYTVISFLPKNLFIQFHRVAYLYFLAIAALNQLPPLAVFGRTVSLFPLLFVVSVTAFKDGYEDWRRHRSDQKENNREALILQSGQFRLKKWKKIRAGEVVKICANETIPSDMVLLATSDPSGIAYIQTINLDGESNLKTRYARQETASTVFEGHTISGLIKCEQPNRNIYEFTANMEFTGQIFPLSQSNIILRGCQLKNTEWVIGVVVYAGQETKAMLNSTASPSKRSRLESHMNRETIWLSVFLFVMCLVVALGMSLWLERHRVELDTLPYYRKRYFTKGSNNGLPNKFYGIAMETLFSFLSSIIVFQIMIPISLYITMEMVRLGQSYFMIEDKQMYDSSSDSRFQCRSLNINEDLGQIRYVFADKTGTLTENKMEFQRASVYGKNYGSSSNITDGTMPEASISAGTAGKRWKLKHEIVPDTELVKLLHKDLDGNERVAAHEFFLTLAACNTVIPILQHRSSCARSHLHEKLEDIDYQGESPDEQALVAAAAAYGYTLIERTSGHIVIDVNGEKLRLDVLGLHEFDSVRKRMSVIIRFPNNAVKVLAKGADSSMLGILAKPIDEVDHGANVQNATQSHLTEYSSQGLRTLVLAARDLTAAEFEEWQHRYEEASTSLTERSTKLRQTAALIECNLNLLGATGIEDKLQDGVPETIESLRQAGIKVWVLTGDKQETAISIGLSCKLLTPDMQRIVINGSSEDECRRLLADAKSSCGVKSEKLKNKDLKHKKNAENEYLEIPDDTITSSVSQWHAGKAVGMKSAPPALVIDGNSLVYILEKDLEPELFDLAIACKVVLCCRVAPLQKAGVVDLIKSRTDDMTLAIGDGANDVSMIQMADVGVGICGQEGRQAVMASDFAMGQFRFLKRLLLVHGHWNYQRVGYLVLYNFYRNAVFVLMLFWYILCTAFSTTSALTDLSSMLYSLLYTSVPTIVVGILDEDLSHKTLLQHPKLYGAGHRQESYNTHLFWITMIDTLWQSLVLFYIPVCIYKESTVDVWSIGSLWTVTVVVLVNIHLAMDINRWISITHIATWGSIAIACVCMVILDSIPIFPNYWTIYHLVNSATYWLAIILTITIALLPRFLYKAIHQFYWPSDTQIAREAEILRKWPHHLRPKPDQGSS
ncbi:phospholipid-transporting ATPase 1-like [Macadamia integrifolia]|uniref:phospholipid-transporting ATPase 1-like n=1 Tax=Macadamia integrifolia TaxID=60698 RepID=UPI001C5297A0|nr:phospholipid-transporting ATPase 1-like [Macadamia integrifolia]XP_042476691.1 phospholipid-transporting ATPase 1-like [Macadamia integrifolia]